MTLVSFNDSRIDSIVLGKNCTVCILFLNATNCLNLTRKHNVLHLSFTLMKKVVKFVVCNIVLGINYSCPVFCLLYFFFFLIMYNHLLLPVLINLYQEQVQGKLMQINHINIIWLFD